MANEDPLPEVGSSGISGLYKHYRQQAQDFLHTILTAYAVVAVSIATTVITSWDKINEILPNTADEVINTYDIGLSLVESTNQLNLILAILGLVCAVVLSIDACGFLLSVLKMPHYASENHNMQLGVENIEEITQKQFVYLRFGYILAQWAGGLAIFSLALAGVAVIGQADLLAMIDLSVLIGSLILISYYFPVSLVGFLEMGVHVGSQIKQKGISPESIKSFTGEEEVTFPSIFSITIATITWMFFLFYGGLVGVVWLLSAFLDVVEASVGIENISDSAIFNISLAFLLLLILLSASVFFKEMRERGISRFIRSKFRYWIGQARIRINKKGGN